MYQHVKLKKYYPLNMLLHFALRSYMKNIINYLDLEIHIEINIGEKMYNSLKKKMQEGFTLVEILIVVVIIGILASIAVPIYFDYVERGYATDAKTQLRSIYESSKMFKSENGDFPDDVTELNDSNGLNIPQSTLDKWDFEINLNDDDGDVTGTITATSLEGMQGGSGEVVTFDVVTGKYTGYGQKDDGSGGE